MLLSRPLPQLLLLGLTLLALTGCSTSSMRNLFSWNRRSEYHTLEELDKQSGRKNAPPAKTASWNPLKRTSSAPAVADGTSSAPSAAKQEVASASPFAGGLDRVDQASAKDPFLTDEAIADASKTRSIQRTSAVISSDDDITDSQATKATEPSEVAEMAEVLIVPGRNRSAAKTTTNDRTASPKTTAEKAVPSSFEAQKLAELDALLEGRELAGARRAGKAASVKAGQAEEALKRAKAAAATRARKATDMAEQSAENTRKVIEESFVAELDALEDRAEPLIRNRPELVEDTEITAVAAAEALFGSQDTATQPSASTPVEESPKFGWKSAASKSPSPTAASATPPFRLAGMQREAANDRPEDAAQQYLAESQPTPEFDAQPVSDAIQHAPTSGPPVRDGSRNTSVLVAAPAPAQSPRPAQQRPVAEVSEAGEETETAESADSSTAVAEVGRAGLLFGLSGRTWCLAAAGGFVLALLFLPTRRRVLLGQTVAGQA